MKTPLTIIIFDGSLKTTSFINRLAEGLAKNHNVYIVGFDDALNNKVAKVKYVALGSSKNIVRLFLRSLKISLKIFIKTGNFSQISKTVGCIIGNKQKRLKQNNFDNCIKLLQPDILHVQWPSLLEFCKNVLANPSVKTILSQRGFQNNVRPFIDDTNFKKLQEQYPKINGFHSVSKAISLVGDKIYNNEKKIDKVVYTGLNLDEIKYNFKKNPASTLNIVSLGRPHWIKGYEYAINAFKILDNNHIPFHYTIVGAQSNEELLYLINDYNLNDKITLTQKVPHTKAIDYIQNADALLLSSIEEGIANVVVEAMAMGTLVISTDCGGMPELITHKLNGWLIPTRNPAAMANAIMDLAKTPTSKLEEIRINARRKVEEQHTEQKMIAGMEALYFEVLDKSNNTNQRQN